MNVLDFIIGVILILFALAGLRKGVIIEVFYLASFIIGIYGAMLFSDLVAVWLSEWLKASTDILIIIAFILTFIAFLILIRWIGRMISRLIEAIHLGFIDKLGGLVFGILKGALILSVFIMLMNIFNLSDLIDKQTRKESVLYSSIEQIANTLYKNHYIIEDSINKSADNSTLI